MERLEINEISDKAKKTLSLYSIVPEKVHVYDTVRYGSVTVYTVALPKGTKIVSSEMGEEETKNEYLLPGGEKLIHMSGSGNFPSRLGVKKGE